MASSAGVTQSSKWKMQRTNVNYNMQCIYTKHQLATMYTNEYSVHDDTI